MTGMAAATIGEVSDLLGALAWPPAICLIFRAPLTALLRRDDVEIKAPRGFWSQCEGAGRGRKGDRSGLR